MESEIVNKVAQSSLEQIDFEKWLEKVEIKTFDLKDCLWQGLVIKEKDFRDFIKNHDWSAYNNFYVNIDCSTEAILQPWVFMLLASSLEPYAKKIYKGNTSQIKTELLIDLIKEKNTAAYKGKKLIVKGCSKINDFEKVLIAFTTKFQPVAKSIMYGEPCSTVPIYKETKKKVI